LKIKKGSPQPPPALPLCGATPPARRTDSAGQATVTLKIDLRSGTLLP